MSVEAAPAAARTVTAGIEWLKLLSAAGIVVFHCGAPGGVVGHAGLPVFLMLASALAARAAAARDWAAYRHGRLRRLLLPWFVWSLFYGALRCTQHALAGAPLFGWWQWSLLWIGTFDHLWYLPFAAVVALAVGRWATSRASARVPPATWAVVGGALVVACSRAVVSGLPMPLPQWLFVAPAIAFGLAIADEAPGRARPRLAVVAVCGVAAALIAWACGWLNLLIPYGVAVPACALAWALPWPAGSRTQAVTRLAFGVYLLHPAVAVAALLWLPLPPTAQGTLAAVTFVGSCLVAALLRLTPLRSVL